VKESSGLIEAVTDDEILHAYGLIARLEGLFAEPACAAPVAGLLRAGRRGLIPKGSLITLTLTGHGLKDPDTAMAQTESEATIVEPRVEAILDTLGFLSQA
jgi:threonine synthase